MNFAVVDCETTGLHNRDRIVEVAIVVLDGQSLEVVDELDTLVNPQRDVGPTSLHGVTASMVSAAPTIAEVAPLLSQRLHGAVLVAHNLSFDQRMLANDLAQAGAEFDPGRGICTLRLSGQRLGAAAESYGIHLEHAHRALADARATAQLFRHLIDEARNEIHPASLTTYSAPTVLRTHRRDVHGETLASPLTRTLGKMSLPTSERRALEYLDALDWALADGVVEHAEATYLTGLADDLGLDRDTVNWLHRAYFRTLVAAAERDGVITEIERQLLERIAAALAVPVESVPAVTERPRQAPAGSGWTVCFTGEASAGGEEISRQELEALAAAAGLQPVGSVTKKTGLCVAADIASESGKARKARSYGIAVISVDEFLTLYRT